MSGVWLSLLCAGMVRWMLYVLMACASCLGLAAPQAIDDAELATVVGRDGIGLAVHLEMNSALLDGADMDSRLTAGFKVHGMTTYAIAQNVGGVIDLFAMTLNVRKQPNGTDYIDLGLPFFVGVSQFGYRALSVQTDPVAPVTHDYGQLLLNGHMAMQGHLYLWVQ